MHGESGRVPSASTKTITPPHFLSIAPQRRKKRRKPLQLRTDPQSRCKQHAVRADSTNWAGATVLRSRTPPPRGGKFSTCPGVEAAPSRHRSPSASLVAASFQLVRELRQPLQPSLLPTVPSSNHPFFLPPLPRAAGPAEVSFAGTFAVGRSGGAGLAGAKFQRSSSFSRSRLTDPAPRRPRLSPTPPPRGGKFLTCPEVEAAPPTIAGTAPSRRHHANFQSPAYTAALA